MNSLKLKLMMVVSALALMVGCGSSGKGTAVTNQTTAAAIGAQGKTAVQSAAELSKTTTVANSTSVQGAIGQAWSSAFSISSQGFAAKQMPQGLADAIAQRDGGSACVTTSGSTYTYACPELTGTITVGTGTITVDLS